MSGITGLVPARFLTIIAHLIITIVILMSREDNVLACLPVSYTQDQYNSKDTELIIGLSVAIGLLALELLSFMAGVSMFKHTQGLISTTLHTVASVALAFFIFETWSCNSYWYIFGICSAFPAVTELIVVVGVLAFHK